MSLETVGKAIVFMCFFMASYGHHRHLWSGFHMASDSWLRHRWVRNFSLRELPTSLPSPTKPWPDNPPQGTSRYGYFLKPYKSFCHVISLMLHITNTAIYCRDCFCKKVTFLKKNWGNTYQSWNQGCTWHAGIFVNDCLLQITFNSLQHCALQQKIGKR